MTTESTPARFAGGHHARGTGRQACPRLAVGSAHYRQTFSDLSVGGPVCVIVGQSAKMTRFHEAGSQYLCDGKRIFQGEMDRMTSESISHGRTPPFADDHVLAGCEASIDSLRECGQLFWNRGWSVGTSSNYSVVTSRDPLELVITASGKDKGRLQRDEFVRIGAGGRPVQEGQPKSSAETLLHVVVAEECEDAGAILHTHSVWGTLLSGHFYGQGGFDIEGYEMLKGLEGITTHEHVSWMTIFDNTQDIPTLAEEVRMKLVEPTNPIPHGFLIRQHGLYTWGKTVDDARRHIEILEFLFECVARRLMLNGVLQPGAVV